jgi:hypothetical protein
METSTEKKLDPEFKAKWVDELRSGRHKQTCGGSLTGNNGTVCVLAVGAICMGMPVKGNENETKVYEKFKELIGQPAYEKLYSLNDSYDYIKGRPINDFNALADYIEQNL